MAAPAVAASGPRASHGGLLYEVSLFFRIMARNRAGLVGFLALMAIALMAIVGPMLIPLDMTMNPALIYQPPSWAHPFGTDFQGRDVWAQLVHGGREILLVSFLGALISTAIAVTFGALGALAGRWVDSAITFVTDIFLTIPLFPLLVVLSVFIKLNNIVLLALLIGFLAWPVLLRAVRSQVLSLKERDFVEAAEALDLGTSHIIFREILPQMRSYIAISFVLAMTNAMYLQTALIYLGLVPLSGNNWAVMLQLAYTRGAIFYRDSLMYILGPIIAIGVVQLALITMTRSLEELFNPRLRTGGA
jgi:peptide/nickel transport system permease protein